MGVFIRGGGRREKPREDVTGEGPRDGKIFFIVFRGGLPAGGLYWITTWLKRRVTLEVGEEQWFPLTHILDGGGNEREGNGDCGFRIEQSRGKI